MKLIGRIAILFYCMHLWVPSALATQAASGGQDEQKKLVTYLLNLGLYLGYNLKKDPTEETKQETNQKLLASTESVIKQKDQLFKALLNSLFGATPVNTAGAVSFVPENSNYNVLNNFANSTFKTPPYSNHSEDGFSVSPLMDQPRHQEDPISQSILNILGTPSYTYCLDNDETEWRSCLYAQSSPEIINKEDVSYQVVGNKLPDKDLYFTYEYNKKYLNQLNAETLTAPLLYSTTSQGGQSTATTANKDENPGLTAQSQVQQAGNFIRYVTNAVVPMPLAPRKQYAKFYDIVFDEQKSELERFRARSTLSEYLASIRVYAAQSSLAMSNFYTILSKRMPQKVGSEENATPTSQALSEFTMATWRLFKPEGQQQQSSKKTWVEELDNASAASVQKEIAVLLAEINYQMYLSRQQQERILLTNSLLVIQNLKNKYPILTDQPVGP